MRICSMALGFALLFLTPSIWATPSVRVIPDQLYFPTLMKALSSAKRRIDILAFSFAITNKDGKFMPQSPPYKVAQKLVDQLAEGTFPFFILGKIAQLRSNRYQNLLG